MVSENGRSNAVGKLLVEVGLTGHGDELFLFLVCKVSPATSGVRLCVDSDNADVWCSDGNRTVALLQVKKECANTVSGL